MTIGEMCLSLIVQMQPDGDTETDGAPFLREIMKVRKYGK